MSRYYLMHRFKEITGYTVHQYTVQKRLPVSYTHLDVYKRQSGCCGQES